MAAMIIKPYNTYRRNADEQEKGREDGFGVSSAKQVPVSNHYDELLELVLRSGGIRYT